MEAEPKLDNRNMIMVLAPDKRARQAAQSRAKAQQRTDKPGASAAPQRLPTGSRNGAGERGGRSRRGERKCAGGRWDQWGQRSRSISRRGMTQCRR